VADLKVNTDVLRAAAGDLVRLANAAHALADSHVRAARLVPALGLDEPAQAVDAFLNSWAYGIRWIAAQSEQIARDLRHSADTYDLVEAQLARAAAGGDPATATAPICATPVLVEEPLPMVRHWTGVLAPPMQLAHATRADQLIPGDPAQVKLLQRLVEDFAEAAYDTRWIMKDTSLHGWTGATANAVQAELIEVRGKLTKAEEAFGEAAGALTGYYNVHADAQAEAAEAVKLWQSAILASQVARGVAVGPAPVDAPADPDAVLARAAALSQDAVERLKLAGKTLAEVLHEAKEGAPKDPGFWAKIRRGVASFGSGLFEGTVTEPIEGAVGIAKLAVALDPARAIYDPDGYVAAQEALYAGVGHVLTHPKEFGSQLIDVKGWREDPIKTFGKFLPDLLALGAAVHAGGLLKGGAAAERLSTSKTVLEDVGRDAVYDRVAPGTARRILDELGVDSKSLEGRAFRKQLNPPYGHLDRWGAAHLQKGQLVAIVNGGEAIVPIDGTLTKDAGEFYGKVQVPARRMILDDGTVSAPMFADDVKIYKVSSPQGLDVAKATAEANTQFGVGGGDKLFVSARDLGDDSVLTFVDEHSFDAKTLESPLEDPAYRAVDPAYAGLDPQMPVRALDPAHEAWVGRAEGLQEKGLETLKESAMSTAAASAAARVDGSTE
jgi:hypothetical protein